MHLIFNDIRGNFVNRVTNLTWTHVLVWLNGYYYEATFPKVRKTKAWQPCKNWIKITPQVTKGQIELMTKYADKMLGTPYELRGYIFPSLYGKTRGVYCSEFACYILMAGGLPLKPRDGYTPDSLLRAIAGCVLLESLEN
ncbi:MAG: hypothetical protein A2Z77_00565 [Chloroflexi bacterium RBG_13_51_36]|nr:MAG: hypothetical protein A2Z77_00565 [Chloroflexi bacterium RBG_13_51_36]